VCPAAAFSASLTTWSAVSAGTGRAAPISKLTSAGSLAQSCAGTMKRSAQLPCSRNGAECAVT
jgi:hypothetical protein